MTLTLPRTALLALLASACGGGGGGSFAITTTPPTSGTIRVPYHYSLGVVHPPGPVNYTLPTAPAGMTITSGGFLQWTPEYADLGTHSVVVRASSNGVELDQAYDLRIAQGLDLGVTLSPRGHTTTSTSQDFVDHFAGHAPWGRIVAFHCAWRESVATAGAIPDVATTAVLGAQQFGYVPAVGFGWSDGQGSPDLASTSEPSNNSWSNAETRAEFQQMVADFADAWRPPYLFLDNETNTWWLAHTPGECDDWLSEFAACYAAIKAVSPDTIVFTVFQLEHLKGLGANAGWSDPAHWSLVDAYATWIFLHDWDGDAAVPSIRGIGLRSSDGTAVRPSDAE